MLASLLLARAAGATCDGTTTSNLGLCKPNHGAYEDAWEVVLNANYDLLDFSVASPLSRTGTAISLGTVPVNKGGTAQTSYTKGDILVASGTTTLVKLGVGSNGQAIVADSAQTTGVKWGSVGSGSALPVTDSTSIVKGSADATKKIRFEVDGLTTATTRVLTPPNRDGTLAYTSGSLTDGNCAKFDASGNIVDNGATCGGGGGGGKQLFTSSSGATDLSTGGDSYMPISGIGLSTAGETSVQLPIEDYPVTAKELCCYANNGSSGPGNGYTFILRDSYLGDTTVQCDAFNGYKCCTTTEDDDIGDIGVEETAVIKIVPSGSPATTTAWCKFSAYAR